MKINKTSRELWPNPCPQVWLRLKMSHLLWHDGENEHLDWVSSMQKAPLCTPQSCALKWDETLIFFNKWIARALVHLPSPLSLSTDQTGRGQAEDLLPQRMLACILREKRARCLACLGVGLRCKPSTQMAETEFSVHWVCYFYPV